jgi:hypothetical protein
MPLKRDYLPLQHPNLPLEDATFQLIIITIGYIVPEETLLAEGIPFALVLDSNEVERLHIHIYERLKSFWVPLPSKYPTISYWCNYLIL